MADIYSEKRVRQIIRDETSGLRDDVRDQAVVLEHIDGKVDTVLELLTDNLKVEGRVKGHETRVTSLEEDNRMTKTTISVHSSHIKALSKRRK